MKITKFGHCCMLIEEKGKENTLRVLTDPGNYIEAQNDLKNIDVVLITHEHADHLHIDSVKKILQNNPEAQIITNSAVAGLLTKEGIVGAKIVGDGESFMFKELGFKAFGKEHAEIFENRQRVQNTGYFIGERLFYPGDAFTNPNIPVDVLAVPVAGPWCKILDSINYYLQLKPKKIFPVHDGGLNQNGLRAVYNGSASIIAKENNIEFVTLEIGKETEL